MTTGTFVKRSLIDPAGTSRRLLSEPLSRATRYALLALVTILSVLLVELGQVIVTGEMAVRMTPFTLTLILACSLVVLTFAIHLMGRIFGGTGTHDQTVLLVAWWQGIGLVIQVAQTIALLILPPMATLVTLVGLAWLVFALLHFVNELHGFGSLFKSLGTVLLGILGFSFGIAFILTLLGVSVQGGPV
ncbi:YIP1 family protein [Salipiger sp. IMCC34102]|uniref:YIP1 family protein n=1 Tax=Salipiger sp. IMCC34102 TaxID=2510647 RepID=UPI0013EB4434|nr:YIP1 family protein [Salipiger sp. IMCC34102]